MRAGLAGLAGVSLADLLRLEASGPAKSPLDSQPGSSGATTAVADPAVIYILQEGGASQFETYDPKPLAPPEIRGQFSPISTSVPGVAFCELMPEQARVMDKLTILRSVHHPSTQHSSSVHLIKTGYYCRPQANENEMPAVGSYIAHSSRENRRMPPYVTLNGGARYGEGLWLGRGCDPFDVTADPNDRNFRIPNLTLAEGLSLERLTDRRQVLAKLDQARRIQDTRGNADAVDQYGHAAFEMVAGQAARRAFDIEQESPWIRDKFGRNPIGQSMLLARRLVEHGVRYLTLGTFGWDHHGEIATQMKREAPAFDRAVAALIEDLFVRGLSERVLVVVMGEFGRAPRLSTLGNFAPGRDHWGDVMSVLMAGGKCPAGEVIGASDSQGGSPVNQPYRLESVLAEIYRHMGIDSALTVNDPNGRPRYILEHRTPIFS
jgi:hypothetical protein